MFLVENLPRIRGHETPTVRRMVVVRNLDEGAGGNPDICVELSSEFASIVVTLLLLRFARPLPVPLASCPERLGPSENPGSVSSSVVP